MSELELMLQHLKQPEYVHILLNPLPIYALSMGVLALVVALALRSQQAQIVALVLVTIGAGSAWPVIHFGKRGYDRVYSMSNRDAQQWLDIHGDRGDFHGSRQQHHRGQLQRDHSLGRWDRVYRHDCGRSERRL